jgi:hypothetical protein
MDARKDKVIKSVVEEHGLNEGEEKQHKKALEAVCNALLCVASKTGK